MNVTIQTSMHEETDEDLFLYMAFKDSDTSMADEAFTEVHRRYIKRVYAYCLKMVSSYPDSETLAEDIASAALAKAYDRAETYQANSNGSDSVSPTFAWLCKIATNIFRDYLRNPGRPGPLNVIELDVGAEMYSPQDFAALYCENQPQLNTQAEYKLVAQAFETLDARTQSVLIETLVQRSRSPGRTYMLRGTAELLANRLATTPENVRRIRRNGVSKINEYVGQHKRTISETNRE